ncbi:MAG: FtsX-like permease family protein [Acidobacteria bacterium]|nr:FtsX-like permease family protein [Acidobacteriota bacterium]
MRFVLQLAIREMRASWQRLIFFFICIAVGVATIVALRSVIQNVRLVLGREARSLLAADVLISSNREFSSEARETIRKRLAEAAALEMTETIETLTMIRPAEGTRPVARLVELKAVQHGFPLYGTIELDGGRIYSHGLLAGHGILVRREVLLALGLGLGDRITVGNAHFTIRGVIGLEPGRRMGGFSLGPRVLIDYDDLPSTGLLSFGSRARRVLLARVPDDRIRPLIDALQSDFKDQYINARSYRISDEEVGRDFARAENYLSLVGLIIVLLGGVAVFSVTRVFILRKLKSIAVLKCLGARNRQILAAYVIQVLALGLAGSLLGVLMARGIVAAIPFAIGPSTSKLIGAAYGITWSAAVQGIGIGVLVSLLFSVVPLLQIRGAKPSVLLHDQSVLQRRGGLSATTGVIVVLGIVGLAAWQADSWKVGLLVCGGFAVLASLLQLAGQLLVRLTAPLARSRSFPLRHAVLHLSRPGSQTRVILLAVGLGAFFIIGVRSLQASLLREFSVGISEQGPDMFLVDIQPDQAETVRAFLADPSNQAGQARLIPVLRARVTGVEGRETDLESYEDVRARGSLAREYTVTYRDWLEPNERIVAGRFWRGPSTEPEVSVERSIHDRFDIDTGDFIRFDILGRIIRARVTSIREVDWRDARTGGFVFVFRTGVLDQVPHAFIAPVKGPGEDSARARFQHSLVERFPNISVIDLREALQAIQEVMAKLTLGITVVGGLILFSGSLILIGSVAMTKFQRVYEAAVFRTLGASARAMAKMLLFEYGVLGALAGLVGSLGALALTWAVSRYVLDIPWRIVPQEQIGGVVITAILVAAIGVIFSLDVLHEKPLSTLRAE